MRRKQAPRPPCRGAVHIIPVPPGMTPDQVWQETTTLGRLARRPSSRGLEWAVYECPGGRDCRCRFVDLSPNYRRYYNDVLVAARWCGLPVPRVLLPVVARVSRRP